MKRRQARLGNGRFTPSTLLNTFGLRTHICGQCGALNPYGRKVVERDDRGFIDPMAFNQWDVPTTCAHCGATLPEHET